MALYALNQVRIESMISFNTGTLYIRGPTIMWIMWTPERNILQVPPEALNGFYVGLGFRI